MGAGGGPRRRRGPGPAVPANLEPGQAGSDPRGPETGTCASACHPVARHLDVRRKLEHPLRALRPGDPAQPVAGTRRPCRHSHRRHRAPSVRGRLPPDADQVHLQRPEMVAWQRDLLDLVGYGTVDLRVVHGRDVRVERLVVPSRPVVLKRWARPAAVRVWRRVSDAVGGRGDDPLIYLSRSSFHGGNEGRAGLVRVKRGMPGWTRSSPSRDSASSTRRPCRSAGRSNWCAGLGCSRTLRLRPASLGVRRPRDRVLIVGDRRSRGKPFPAQVMVSTACGHHWMFVPNEDDVGLAERALAGLSA